MALADHLTHSAEPANSKDKLNSIDVFVSRRIRTLREERGMSQESLGDAIGVSFQQIQKYENGTNRVSASRLAGIAKALGCTIAELFPPDDSVRVPDRDVTRYADNYEALRVVRAFNAIADAAVRGSLLAIVELVSRCPGT